MRKLIPAVRAAHIRVFIVPHHRWREGDYKRMEAYESITNPAGRTKTRTLLLELGVVSSILNSVLAKVM